MPNDEPKRPQFTFYGSFFQAIARIKKKTDRCDAYDAICAYALRGVEPDLDALPDAAAIAFELAKPNLDASKRKASAGKIGGSKAEANRKQSGSKREANRKQEETASEKENEKENEIEIEKEKESYYDDGDNAREDDGTGEVFRRFMDEIHPTPSQSCIDEIRGYIEEMGADCVLRAIDIAIDNKVPKWTYIRAVLQDKLREGVRSLANWDALEERRAETSARSGATQTQRAPERKSFAEIAAELEDKLKAGDDYDGS